MSGAAVDALVERARRIRWLAPDAAMDALDDGAQAWVRERADEHLAALEPYLLGVAVAADVRFTRDLTEAAARWDDAWAKAPVTHYAVALNHARRRLDDAGAHDAAEAARAAVLAALPPPTLWERLLGHGARDTLPGAVCAELHAQWLAAFAEDPSPWGPLFDVWERGLWPLALPDGQWLVYVPLVVDGEIRLSTTAAPLSSARPPWGPDPIPVRRPRPSAGSPRLFPRAEMLGCGPAPGRDRPVLAMPLAGAPMPVHPLPIDAMPHPPLSGAVPQVSPVPIAPEPPKPEPWYKRLFR